jgi:hypothetical protein
MYFKHREIVKFIGVINSIAAQKINTAAKRPPTTNEFLEMPIRKMQEGQEGQGGDNFF